MYGEFFEDLVVIEIYLLNLILKKDFQLFYLRIKNSVEIDLILERKGRPTILIKIKSKLLVNQGDAL